MGTSGHVAFPAPARSGLLRFVWDSWRGITRGDLALWLLLGVAVGPPREVPAPSSQATRVVAPVYLVLRRCARSDSVALPVPGGRPQRSHPPSAALGPIRGRGRGSGLALSRRGGCIRATIRALDDPALWPGLTMDWVRGTWLNLPPMVLLCFLVSFGYMYALDARRRADALRAVQLDVARIGRQSYESRLQAMQARVEPQFLFETLGQVEQLYETDPPLAERVLDDLIVYLRGVLPSLDNSNSTVSIELEIARAWLDIMKARARRLPLRFGREARRCRRWTDAAHGAASPDRACGENAGTTAGLRAGACHRSDARGERLRVVVTDSAGAFATAAETDPVADVRSRLHSLYGMAATLSFVGTQAIVEPAVRARRLASYPPTTDNNMRPRRTKLAVALGFGVVAHSRALAQDIRVNVTGTNIKRVDTETAAPIETITREDIQASGLQTISDVVRQITANNNGTISPSFTNGFSASGSARVAARPRPQQHAGARQRPPARELRPCRGRSRVVRRPPADPVRCRRAHRGAEGRRVRDLRFRRRGGRGQRHPAPAIHGIHRDRHCRHHVQRRRQPVQGRASPWHRRPDQDRYNVFVTFDCQRQEAIPTNQRAAITSAATTCGSWDWPDTRPGNPLSVRHELAARQRAPG